jgi:hypothetical protein
VIEAILAYALVTVGSALLAYATLGRLLGVHRPMPWQGGGQLTFAGELACGTFVLSLGLCAARHSALWVIPALVAWGVGYCSQWRANRRHASQEDDLRQRNAANFPGVFDHPPPQDIDRVESDELDVFDSGACTYLGRAARHDLKALIDRFRELPEQGPNDIFLIPESLALLPDGALSPDFTKLLQRAFETRDFVVLRWLPPSQAASVLAMRT